MPAKRLKDLVNFRDEGLIEVKGTVHHVTDRQSQDRRILFEFAVQPSQIPAVVEQLRRKGKNSAWVVFMFYTAVASAGTADDCPNLQYSIQSSTVGLDWVLLGQRNIADKAHMTEFITSRGHAVSEIEMNEVKYLRVEDGDLDKLGLSIVEEFYGMPRDADIGVLVSGFSLLLGGRTLH